MKSGETAGHGNGPPTRRPHGKRSAQARSWKPGRRRQPSGARERWKPVRGETPQAARCEARQRDRPCSLAGDAHAVVEMQRGSSVVGKQPFRHRYCRAGVAGAAVLQGRQAKRGGDVPKALPPECKRQRAAPQARSHRHQGRSRKKGAPPRRAAHRMAPGAISSPSSSATARSRRVRRRRTAGRPRSAR